MALGSYKAYLDGFPVTSESQLTVFDPSGETGFKCDLAEFKQIFSDEQVLYRTLIPSYVALIEDHARDLIEIMINKKGIKVQRFAGLTPTGDLDVAISHYVTATSIEIWGSVIFKEGGRDWSKVKGGKYAVVKAAVVRNLLAHGVSSFNERAVNRLSEAATSTQKLKLGDPLIVDRTAFKGHVATLKSYGRLLSDAVANLPDP